MRITYISLTGYVGIYNGMGLNTISIDMSRSMHKVCVISGINGCGKSTLLRAMTIMPDSNKELIANMKCSKYMMIEDCNNQYIIDIQYGSPNKAFIKKNGEELNPNGNISSYKEIIFTEFDLDSNYIALSRLSSDDRGIADKSPAERKKFMSFIVDSIDTYNAIYKNLNKKSSIYKSHINNLHNKIQSIGDEGALRSQLVGLESKKNDLNAIIREGEIKIAENRSLLKSLDPLGQIVETYTSAKNDMDIAGEEKEKTRAVFVDKCNEYKISVSCEELRKQLDHCDVDIVKQAVDTFKTKKLEYITKMNSIVGNLEEKKRKLSSLSNTIDPSYEKRIEDLRAKIGDCLSFFIEKDIDNYEELTASEVKIVYDTMLNIIDMIENFYTEIPSDLDMRSIINYLPTDLAKAATELDSCNRSVVESSNKVSTICKDMDTIMSAISRPTECKIDSCPFISEAVILMGKYNININSDVSISDQVNKIIDYNADILNGFKKDLDRTTDKVDTINKCRELNSQYRLIVNTINSNANVIQLVDIGKEFISVVFDTIARKGSFGTYKVGVGSLTDLVTVLTLYKNTKEDLDKLEKEYYKVSGNVALVQSLKEEIETLTNDYKKNQDELELINDSLEAANQAYEFTVNTKNHIEEAISLYGTYIVAKTDYDISREYFLKVSKDSKTIVDKNTEIGQISSDLTGYKSQIAPIEDLIARTKGQLMMLDSYKEEYDQYSNKFNTIQVLKNYCSPTTGIQTMFMNVYMNKTLSLANEVLGLIFGGQYRLLDYVINANEFKMPFIGNGMRVDDISSGSTSQICMMGMVMNLVLKYQASPRYNIVSLDEIDGGLDTRNRTEFITILYRIIDILKIDQLFIISHSLELELSNVDIIKLKSYEDYDAIPDSGSNILYDFNKETSL